MASNAQKKSFLEDLLSKSASFGAGGVDELLFGLPSTYVAPETFKGLEKENPASYMSGRVGSYFVPGLGGVGAAKTALRGITKANSIKTLLKLAASPQGAINIIGAKGGKIGSNAIAGTAEKLLGKEAAQGIIPRILQRATGEGISGGIQAGANTAIRKGFGTSQYGDGGVLENIESGGTLGASLGAISPAAGAAARSIYGAKRIINPKAPREVQEKVLDRLMSEGHFGGRKTFENVADKAQENYSSLLEGGFQPIYAKNKGVNAADVIEGIDNAIAEKKKFNLGTDIRELQNRRSGILSQLGPQPSAKEVNDLLSSTNKEMSKLSEAQRLRAYGAPGAGDATSELQSMGAAKQSLKDWQRKALIAEHGDKGAELYDKAMKDYGFGAELNKALDRPESLSETIGGLGLPLASGAGVGYGLTQATQGNLAPLAASVAGSAGIIGSKTLPARTSLGILLDRASSEGGPGFISGKVTERRSRLPVEEENPYSKFTTVDESNPYMRYNK